MLDLSKTESSISEDDNQKGLKSFYSNLKNKDDNLIDYEKKSKDNSLIGYKNFIRIKESNPVLTLKKRHENSAKYIFQMKVGCFIVFQSNKNKKEKENNDNEDSIIKEIKSEIKNKILLKDIYYNEKKDIKLADDESRLFIFEIKDHKNNYAIICGNKYFYQIAYIDCNSFIYRKIDININICLILQIRENEKNYIISCKNGTYYYEGSLLEISDRKLVEENLISRKPYKKGVIIDDRYAFFLYNEDMKGYLHIYDTNDKVTKKNYNNYIKNPYNSFIKKTLSVINFEKDGKKKTVVLCACKGKGILLIKKEEEDEIRDIYEIFYDIKDFNIKSICPLKDFKIDNNNIELIDTEYIIVVGENDNEMEMRLYKIEGLESNSYPTIYLDYYLFCKDDISLDGISSVVQSKKKGNLIITYLDGTTKELYFIEYDE